MSGLFATLIDAARGSAPVILQRPRPHFAAFEALAPPSDPAGDEEGEPAAPPGAAPGQAHRAIAATAERPREERRRPEPSGEGRGEERVVERRPGPRARLPASHAEPDTAPRTILHPPRFERRTEAAPASPRADAKPAPEDEARRPSGRMPPPPGREGELLLPELAKPPLTGIAEEPGQVGRPRLGPEPPVREEAGRGLMRVDLRIGRIEVTAPQPRSIAPPSARAVIVPRAKPRQSLDDYLSRRRQ